MQHSKTTIGGMEMKKEKIIVRVLVAWLIFSVAWVNLGAIEMIIDLLQYSLLIVLPVVIIIVLLTIIIDVMLTILLIETKEEWK